MEGTTKSFARFTGFTPLMDAAGIGTALGLARFRNTVRRTAGLVSTQGHVNEKQADRWAADLDTRTILWRTSWHDGAVLTDEEVLFVVTHEASHLNYTGGYAFPAGLSPDKRKKFHRFVNAGEDVRIERLAGVEFPGFVRLRSLVNGKLLRKHRDTIQGASLMDQVWLIWHARDNDLDGLFKGRASQKANKLADSYWPLFSRICNADSTADLARGLYPIFVAIEQAAPKPKQQPQDGDQGAPDQGGEGQGQGGGEQGGGEQGDGKGDDEGAGQGKGDDEGQGGEAGSEGGGDQGGEQGGDQGGTPDGKDGEDTAGSGTAPGTGDGEVGGDAPSTRPVKSSHNQHDDNRPGAVTNKYDDDGNILRGMAEDAVTMATTTKLSQQAQAEQNARRSAEDEKRLTTGQDWRKRQSAFAAAEGVWDRFATEQQVQTGALARKLAMVLRHNAMDAWEGGHRRGRLNSRQAYRAMSGNPRIFRKKGAVGGHDYSFALLFDNSTSMQGQERNTMRCVVTLATALEKVGLGVAVIPWNSRVMGVKTLDDSLAKARGFLANCLHKTQGGTREINALIAAEEALRKAPPSQRVYITVTDGDTNNKHESVETIGRFVADGSVCIGVGIGIPAPDHYPHGVSYPSMKELVEELPRLIGGLVKKGA